MNLICKITDNDIDEEKATVFEPKKIRLGARGIVVRNDNKIAIFYKENKNQYKLPGGGIDTNETPEDAFKREVLEETGCIVEITKKLGITEEYKSKTSFQQISYIFVGKVIKETSKLNITKKEQEEGAKLLWETPENALKLITNCFDKLVASNYESIYTTKFVVLRDRKILEHFINNQNKRS